MHVAQPHDLVIKRMCMWGMLQASLESTHMFAEQMQEG